MLSARAAKAAVSLVFAWILAASGNPAFAQIEVEPNDPCSNAQDLGTTELPYLVDGMLDSTPSHPDVDFYRIHVTIPEVVVNLTGGPTVPRIPDAFLGVFDSSCNLIAASSDGGPGGPPYDAQLRVATPPDGVLILAATVCCDEEFIGGGIGSYSLSYGVPPPDITVSGRIVDADTGAPVRGDVDPFAFASLFFCVGECFGVDGMRTDAEGRFHFPFNAFEPLRRGTYYVAASAKAYAVAQTPQFEITEGGNTDIGDLAIHRLPVIGSISGRLVERVSGKPVPGDQPPFGIVDLLQCDESSCFNVAQQATDAEGGFRFEKDSGFSAGILGPGTYQVVASSSDHLPVSTERFEVADRQDVNLRTVKLKGLTPVTVSGIQPCDALPPRGGTCRFSARLTSRSNAQYVGGAWALAATAGATAVTEFQPSPAQSLDLPRGSSVEVPFEFHVPASVANGTTICADVLVGKGATAYYFQPVVRAPLFCVSKGAEGFGILTDQEAAKAREQIRARRK